MRKLIIAALGTILSLSSVPQAMAGIRYYENKTSRDVQLIVYVRTSQSSAGSQGSSQTQTHQIPAGQKVTVTFDGDSLKGVMISGGLFCSWRVIGNGDSEDMKINRNTHHDIIVSATNPFMCDLKGTG